MSVARDRRGIRPAGRDPARQEPIPDGGAAGRLVRLQQAAGNRGVAALVARSPAPTAFVDPLGDAVRATQERMEHPLSVNERADFVTLDPAPAMPPQVQQQLLSVRTTLTRIPPMSAADQATMRLVAPGAPVLEMIQKRELLRADIAEQQSEVTRRAPPARLPDDQMAALEAEVAPFTQRMQYDEAEIQKLQTTIDAVVRGVGVADEAALVKLMTVDFPEIFVRRAKLIAHRQLDDNMRIAREEAERYGLGIPGMGAGSRANPADFARKPEDIGGLRKAAARLLGIARETSAVERRMTAADAAARDAAGRAGAEIDHSSGAGAGSYATPPPEPVDFSADLAKLEAFRAEGEAIRLQFPILYRPDLDLQALTSASDDDVARATGAEVGKVLANIADTKRAIDSDRLPVWSLRNIVDLTLIDMGVARESPLVHVVERAAADQKADESILHTALAALALVAGVVAAVSTGGLAVFAGAVATGIGGYEVAKSVQNYSMESAANDVALDPAIADISVNDPEILPIVLSLVGTVTAAGELARAVNALRLPAKALVAGGDIATFAKAARSVLPEAEAERFVAAAGRAVGQDEVTLNAIRAVGDTYRHADLAQVSKLVGQHAEVGFKKLFDQLSSAGRVHPLNAETVEFYLGRAAVEEMQAAAGLRAWYHRSTGRLFIREGMNRETFAGWATHEITHHVQDLTVYGSSLSFEAEFQAYRMQQQYLHSLERSAGDAAIPAQMKWLSNATDDDIAQHITQMYGYQSPAVLDGEATMQPLLDILARLEG